MLETPKQIKNQTNHNKSPLPAQYPEKDKSRNSQKIAQKTAKVFMNGRSQAVRLPAQFRFDVDEVYIRQDEVTGDVTLSKRPNDWAEFFEAQEALTDEDLTALDEMMHILSADREKARQLVKKMPQEDIFSGWEE